MEPSPVHLAKQYSPMAFEPEGQASIAGDNTCTFQNLEMPKASNSYLQKSRVYAMRLRPHLVPTLA